MLSFNLLFQGTSHLPSLTLLITSTNFTNGLKFWSTRTWLTFAIRKRKRSRDSIHLRRLGERGLWRKASAYLRIWRTASLMKERLLCAWKLLWKKAKWTQSLIASNMSLIIERETVGASIRPMITPTAFATLSSTSLTRCVPKNFNLGKKKF